MAKEIQFNNEVKLFINRLYKSIISNHFVVIVMNLKF